MLILAYMLFPAIAYAQKVFVTSGTTSAYYHKSADCSKLKAVGSPAFSISIEQAKSIGKKQCEQCYSGAKSSSANQGSAQSTTKKNSNNITAHQ